VRKFRRIAMINLTLLITHSLVRAGLVSLLRSLGFDNVTEAASLDDLMEDTGRLPPEIVLVGLSRCEREISDVMSAIRTRAPVAKVAFLATDLDLKVPLR
jgi:DNA-binding NarL/FixJ family response regulator